MIYEQKKLSVSFRKQNKKIVVSNSAYLGEFMQDR